MPLPTGPGPFVTVVANWLVFHTPFRLRHHQEAYMANIFVRTALVLSMGLALLVPVAQAEGNLAANATRLPDLNIDTDALTFSQTHFDLETGKYYRLRIVHDGGEEMALMAPELFRNSWINQVIVNDLEITPYGLYSVEFDDEGTFDVWFVPIRPGEYKFWMPMAMKTGAWPAPSRSNEADR